MSELIQLIGLRVVQCKAAFLFIMNSFTMNEDILTNFNDFISFNYLNSYLNSSAHTSNFDDYLFRVRKGLITIDYDKAMEFISGKTNDISYSAIYQLSQCIIKQEHTGRFKRKTWGVEFKGKPAIDAGGVTNQTISMATSSFLYPMTEICVVFPNKTESKPGQEHLTNILVIPYPSKNDESTQNILYAFGQVLGSIIRGGINQDIPFPLFVWDYLIGKPITAKDIYENDKLLEDEIKNLKNGNIKDHEWVYRDWNNIQQKINEFPEKQYVTKELSEVYERIVLNTRIKSLESRLIHIRKGLWNNIDIDDNICSHLNGSLIRFLTNGNSKFDCKGIIKKVVCKNGTTQLKNNLKTILDEFDVPTMKCFLRFVTNNEKPPNFAIVPGFCIYVNFHSDISKLPVAHTCFNTIDVPSYPSIEIMKEKLKTAIFGCFGLDIV